MINNDNVWLRNDWRVENYNYINIKSAVGHTTTLFQQLIKWLLPSQLRKWSTLICERTTVQIHTLVETLFQDFHFKDFLNFFKMFIYRSPIHYDLSVIVSSPIFDLYIHFNQPEKFDAEGLGESWNAQLPIQQNCVW